MMTRLGQKIYGNAYFVLIVATWFWAGNTIAGRYAVGHISPILLTSLRWLVGFLVLYPLTRREIAAVWPQIRPLSFKLSWMAATGLTGFSYLIYLAAYSTGAANMSIIQGITPAVVMLGAFIVYHTRITGSQIIGLITAFTGVVVIGVKGDYINLKTMSFAFGDIWMVMASTFYAVYTLGLRNRPPLKGLAFFCALCLPAFLISLVLVGVEIARGEFFIPTFQGWLVLLYVALFPTLLSQVFYIRGVELIGPSRAGLFINLIPVFGTLMAAVAPGESFEYYHLLGLLLVLGGIITAERR
ncbi:MAG: DMT family transporter [Methylobacteriaceae bacterium]|jgi:drug/metabolite transporter (DMT)-like permease|nr:DMT family transporter [Methylobacteriaceae bacterium]